MRDDYLLFTFDCISLELEYHEDLYNAILAGRLSMVYIQCDRPPSACQPASPDSIADVAGAGVVVVGGPQETLTVGHPHLTSAPDRRRSAETNKVIMA